MDVIKGKEAFYLMFLGSSFISANEVWRLVKEPSYPVYTAFLGSLFMPVDGTVEAKIRAVGRDCT